MIPMIMMIPVILLTMFQMALPPVTRSGWEAALDIVIHKPHSVDKRLAGQVELEVWEGEWVEREDENEWVLGEDNVSKIIEMLGEEKEVKVLQDVLGGRETGSGKVVIKVILQKLIGRNERFSSFYQLVVRREDMVEFIPLNVVDLLFNQVEL